MADSSLGISASGLKAARTKLAVSANNTANINTKGFKKKEVLNSSIESGGVKSSVREINTEGIPQTDASTGEAVEGSNVDLIEESVNRISANSAAKANASAIKARDEMLGTIINVKS